MEAIEEIFFKHWCPGHSQNKFSPDSEINVALKPSSQIQSDFKRTTTKSWK